MATPGNGLVVPTLGRMEVLDVEKVRVLKLQEQVVNRGDFFLAGGTGLGLHLGHRKSMDLDWFTPKEFDPEKLKDALERLPEAPTQIEQQGKQTLRAFYGDLETSFILYQQVRSTPERFIIAGANIPVADIKLIAAMKAAAVHDRGFKRDFVDIHAICKLPGWSVSKFVEVATKSLPLSTEQVRLSLTYFADAEKQRMPAGCTISWERIKADLGKGVKDSKRNRQQDIDR